MATTIISGVAVSDDGRNSAGLRSIFYASAENFAAQNKGDLTSVIPNVEMISGQAANAKVAIPTSISEAEVVAQGDEAVKAEIQLGGKGVKYRTETLNLAVDRDSAKWLIGEEQIHNGAIVEKAMQDPMLAVKRMRTSRVIVQAFEHAADRSGTSASSVTGDANANKQRIGFSVGAGVAYDISSTGAFQNDGIKNPTPSAKAAASGLSFAKITTAVRLLRNNNVLRMGDKLCVLASYNALVDMFTAPDMQNRETRDFGVVGNAMERSKLLAGEDFYMVDMNGIIFIGVPDLNGAESFADVDFGVGTGSAAPVLTAPRATRSDADFRIRSSAVDGVDKSLSAAASGLKRAYVFPSHVLKYFAIEGVPGSSGLEMDMRVHPTVLNSRLVTYVSRIAPSVVQAEHVCVIFYKPSAV